MTDDLVNRLRCYADLNDPVFHPWVYGEAADRIEKLEAALRAVTRYAGNSGDDYLANQCRKALEGKDV